MKPASFEYRRFRPSAAWAPGTEAKRSLLISLAVVICFCHMHVRSFSEVEAILSAYISPIYFERSAAVAISPTMGELLRLVGNPQHSFKVIHVAGTSGKTSTAYYIAALLRQSGAKVGLTVSPHVDSVSERLQINLKTLEEAQYCAAFSKFIGLVQSSDLQPTYFELLVAFALWEFARQKVDYAVVEAGIGGRYDSTNVITATNKVSVLTDIGLGHMKRLGDTLPEIALHKAGIMTANGHAFCLIQTEEVLQVFRHEAELIHATLHVVRQGKGGNELPEYQRRNWSLARQVVDWILQRDGYKVLSSIQYDAARAVYIPARMEIQEYAGATLVLDAAHNVQKVQVLAKSILQQYPGRRFTVLLGLSFGEASKALDARLASMIQSLSPIAKRLIITRTSARDVAGLPGYWHDLVVACQKEESLDIMLVDDATQAYDIFLQAPDNYKLATGSFLLLHDIRAICLLQKQG